MEVTLMKRTSRIGYIVVGRSPFATFTSLAQTGSAPPSRPGDARIREILAERPTGDTVATRTEKL